MVSELGKVSPEVAIDLLKKSENHVKTAIVMAQLGIDAIEARLLLEAEKGYLGRVLGTI
jgi:N-acetylmuramic acid 6-phosphate (MurNAc-6-P) etherase